MKKVCSLGAFAALLASIALAVVSAVSYPKHTDTPTQAAKKALDVKKFQNLAMVLALVAIALYLACMLS